MKFVILILFLFAHFLDLAVLGICGVCDLANLVKFGCLRLDTAVFAQFWVGLGDLFV